MSANFWQAFLQQIQLLSETKTRLVELLNQGEGSSSEFIAGAKKLIKDASALVDTTLSVRGIRGDEAEVLQDTCSRFSGETVHFIHASRGVLFDSTNSEFQERFAAVSVRMDSVLAALMELVERLMEEYPSANAGTAAAETAPTKPTAPAGYVSATAPQRSGASANANANATASNTAPAAASPGGTISPSLTRRLQARSPPTSSKLRISLPQLPEVSPETSPREAAPSTAEPVKIVTIGPGSPPARKLSVHNDTSSSLAAPAKPSSPPPSPGPQRFPTLPPVSPSTSPAMPHRGASTSPPSSPPPVPARPHDSHIEAALRRNRPRNSGNEAELSANVLAVRANEVRIGSLSAESSLVEIPKPQAQRFILAEAPAPQRALSSSSSQIEDSVRKSPTPVRVVSPRTSQPPNFNPTSPQKATAPSFQPAAPVSPRGSVPSLATATITVEQKSPRGAPPVAEPLPGGKKSPRFADEMENSGEMKKSPMFSRMNSTSGGGSLNSSGGGGSGGGGTKTTLRGADVLLGLKGKLMESTSNMFSSTSKIHRCAATGDLEGVKTAIGKGGKKELNVKNEHGATPLHLSLRNKHEVIALILISSGADLDIPDDTDGALPLQLAVAGEMYDACELMVDRGVNLEVVNVKNKGGATLIEALLRNCASKRGMRLFENALAKGASLSHKNKFGDTYLHLAAASGWYEVAERVLRADPAGKSPAVNVNDTNSFGETCLHKAARVGDVEMVRLLLRSGADQMIAGDNGVPHDVASKAEVKALLTPSTLRNNQAGGGGSSTLIRVGGSLSSSGALDGPNSLNLSDRGRGRALTKALDSLHASNDMAMEKAMNKIVLDLSDLDTEMQALAKRRSRLVRPSGVAPSPSASGVFEDYEGAMYELECGRKGVNRLPPLTLDADIEPFRQKFYGKRMYHFLTRSWQKGEVAVLAVVATPDAEKGTLSALLVSSSGEQPLDLNFRGLEEGFTAKALKKQLETSFTPGKKWKEILDRGFEDKLLALETSHSRNANCYRFGVCYGKADQKTEAEMFLNREGSDEFNLFLNLIAERIELRGWSGYSGGLNQEDCAEMPYTYYTSWRGMEIMLHVSTLMTPEQQRRLIGNDIGLIFFQPSDAAFRVAMRGNVNSVAAVIAPADGKCSKFKLGVFRRGNIRSFDPHVPEDGLVSSEALKDFLFTKMINGTLAAHRSPPLSHLHQKVYRAALEDLITPYLSEKK